MNDELQQAGGGNYFDELMINPRYSLLRKVFTAKSSGHLRHQRGL